MHILRKTLLHICLFTKRDIKKKDLKIPHSDTGGQGNAIQGIIVPFIMSPIFDWFVCF